MDYHFQFREKISVKVEGHVPKLNALLQTHPWFALSDSDACDLLFSNTPLDSQIPLVLTCPDPGAISLIPEINGGVLANVKRPVRVSHPNGVATALALALKPLDNAFGIGEVYVNALLPVDDVSIPSLDVLDSALPVAYDLAEQLRNSLPHLLGRTALRIDAQSVRIAMSEGLMLQVAVKFLEPATSDQMIHSWKTFQGLYASDDLPSKPQYPIHFFSEKGFPQVRLHRQYHKGQVISIGALQQGTLFDHHFVVVSNPEVRGPIGGAVLNAELLVKKGLVYW